MLRCKRPDHDVAELVCGFPLPCPYHTITFNMDVEPTTITIPATMEKVLQPKMLNKLKKVAKALKP